jgi:type II secretory pathway pseudopilin PulG
MLLFLMLAVAMLMITMLGVARNYRRSIIRDREVEMIHRGEQYERAVKRYYHKFGNYPASIEQLENTNKVRFLRKRYKDPMSPDGAWKLVHLTDVTLKAGGGLLSTTGAGGVEGSQTNPLQPNAGGSGNTANGTPRGTDGSTAGTSTSGTSSGANNPAQDPGATTGGTTDGTTGSAFGGATGSAFGGATGGTVGGATGATGPAGSSSNGNNPVLGGGPVLGVVSKQKTEGIHSFGDKTKYNEWLFIYDPSQDKGQMLVGPYNPNMFLGANSNGLGNSTQNPTGTATGTGTGTTTGTGTGTGSTNPGSATPPAASTQ